MIDGERTTRVGGLVAVWRPTHDTSREIEVMAVHGSGGSPGAVRFAPGTDLAEARTLRPEWNRLWDRVRHEFWSEIASPAGPTAVSGGTDGRHPHTAPYGAHGQRIGDVR